MSCLVTYCGLPPHGSYQSTGSVVIPRTSCNCSQVRNMAQTFYRTDQQVTPSPCINPSFSELFCVQSEPSWKLYPLCPTFRKEPTCPSVSHRCRANRYLLTRKSPKRGWSQRGTCTSIHMGILPGHPCSVRSLSQLH
jgi:hypothetical protein